MQLASPTIPVPVRAYLGCMRTLPRDLRLAAHSLLRKPGVTALAVVSLALSIGFSTAAFSVLDAVSLRDLPVARPSELAWISARTRENRADDLTFTEYRALAARSRLFSEIIAQDREAPRVRLPDRDDFPITSNASDNYFDALGVRAAFGDVFHRGRGQDATVVLSHRYWEQAFASDPAILGRSLEVRGVPLRIIGVLPPGFNGASRGIAVDLFVPSQTYYGIMHAANPDDLRYTEYELAGRLRPGVTLEQARIELDGILRQVERDGLAPGPDRHTTIESLAEGGLRSRIVSNAVFLAAIFLLILIAAANLANLRLVDNESHRRETGIRLALGAGRASLARGHLAETLLLAAGGTAAGLLLAAWLIRAAAALLYAGKRYVDFNIRLDARTFAFSSAALIAVALTGALIPLADAWKRRISPALSGTRVTGTSRWLAALVIVQMALVTGVTCSAGLLWRSLQNIAAIRPAMDPDRPLLLVRGFFAANGDPGAVASTVSTVPGVARVAWARRALLSGSGGGASVPVQMPGQPKLSFRYDQVSPNYFETTGAHILSGRGFTESDGPAATRVVMVNSAFVRRFLAGRDPIGVWVTTGGKPRQIVGVVEDGPTIHLREVIEPYLYFPFAQMPTGDITLFVETRRDPSALAAAVRAQIRAAGQGFTITDGLSMREHMRGARSSEQLASAVTGALAAVGLLLAAAGLFGVSLFAVSRRIPEFGVRVAMGATPANLASQVFREAAVHTALAIPLGWGLAFTARHALEKMLYGIAPDDPSTFFAASILVGAVGCAAALYPAIRASRIDPVTALRQD